MQSKWPTKKLGEICERIDSGEWGQEYDNTDFVPCKVIRGTDFLLVQSGDFSEIPIRFVDKLKLEKLELKYGDILVEISGGSKDQPTGRILFWDKETQEPVIFSNFLKRLKICTEKVHPKYFFRYWQFLYLKGRTVDYEERTTNIRNFKLKDFLDNEKIPLPPLSIQQKIVKILDTIQEAVEIQEKIIEKTKELKKSLMAELFKYGGPSFRKGRKLKKTEIGEIPENWEVVRLGEIARLERGKFAHRPRNDPKFYGGDIPFIQTNDVVVSNVYIKEYSQTLNEKGLSVSRLFPRGTIVITIAASIGYVGILEFDSAFPDSIIGITPKSNVDKLFLTYYLINQQPIIDSLASRGTQKNINIRFLSSWPVPLPLLSEQRQMAEILQTIDQKIEIEKRKKELYEELFKTMLNKIMNQEIDVEKINLD